MTLYIFRHGLATKSTTGYGSHVYSAPLLPEGREAILKLGKFLQTKPVDYFVSSSFTRCIQTAGIVAAQTHKQFFEEKRLNEYVDVSFPQFVQRVKSFLDDLHKQKKEYVWICTHVAVIAVIKRLLKNEKVTDLDVLNNTPRSGTLLILSEQGEELVDFNGIS